MIGLGAPCDALLWQPDEIGLARAWVAGEIDLEGDSRAGAAALRDVGRPGGAPPTCPRERVEMLRAAALLGVIGLPPTPPPEEIVLSGQRHSKSRDRVAVTHHYDVGNDFYEIVLGPSMTYSCAYWARPDDPTYSLEDAQRDKLELICRKLGLGSGMRLLDVGCGWGSLVVHAARAPRRSGGRHHPVPGAGRVRAQAGGRRPVSPTVSRSACRTGVTSPTSRSTPSRASAWPSTSGRNDGRSTPRTLHGLLVPGAAAQPPDRPAAGAQARGRTFIDAYVFPDGELLPLGATWSPRSRAPTSRCATSRACASTTAAPSRRWVDNLERQWDRAVELAGSGRARVWRLYMTASALSFDAGRIGVAQVLAVRRQVTAAVASRHPGLLARGHVSLLAVTVIGHDRPGHHRRRHSRAGRSRAQPRGLVDDPAAWSLRDDAGLRG